MSGKMASSQRIGWFPIIYGALYIDTGTNGDKVIYYRLTSSIWHTYGSLLYVYVWVWGISLKTARPSRLCPTAPSQLF